MKSLFILLAFAATIFTKASAADGIVHPAVLHSFKNTFTTATDVAWTAASADLFKASFELSGQKVAAYFNNDGKMVAITRNLTSLQLPVALQAEIKKDYSHQWITDLFEVTTDSGISYYLTLEDAEGKVVLKSGASNHWNVYQKTKKD